MSSIKLAPNASGTGEFTIAAPNSNTNRTLTLPDATGLVLLGNTVTGRLPNSNAPSGSVIQVVSGVGTAISVSTGTPTIVVQASITILQGSRVLVSALGDMNPAVGGNWHNYRLYRDETGIGQSYIGQTAAASYNLPFSISALDVALTAGSYTYSLRVWQGSGAITYGETGNIQAPTIVLMEIAA